MGQNLLSATNKGFLRDFRKLQLDGGSGGGEISDHNSVCFKEL